MVGLVPELGRLDGLTVTDAGGVNLNLSATRLLVDPHLLASWELTNPSLRKVLKGLNRYSG